MKFGFVTCVQLGLSCIEKIYEIGGELDLLITLHDHKSKSKSGRIYLDKISNQYQIPLLKINHINDAETINAIKEYQLDWLFIIGWSQIASSQVIHAPKNGCIGMHPTLLPVGRGRAAIPWAIIKGLHKTGVSMFVLDEGVDTGGILGQYEINVEADEIASTLYEKVEVAHELLMEKIFPLLKNNSFSVVPQNEQKATLWEGRKPEDGELFSTMTVEEADRLIRACTKPYPGAFFKINGMKRIIWRGKRVEDSNLIDKNIVKFSDGAIEIIEYEDIIGL